MSLILDALKKLDRERSSRQKGAANIAVEIVRPDLPRSGKRVLRYLAAACLAAVASAAITYVVMMEFGFLSRSSAPVPLNAAAKSQQVAPAPHFPEPVRDARGEISGMTQKMQILAERKIPVASKNHVTSPGEGKATRNVIPPTQNGPVRTPPSLNLSAIAWSEEPSKRIAFINDTITREGSEILGAKIVEISPHRVRFSYEGQAFELSLPQ